jgi:hypothetical protein
MPSAKKMEGLRIFRPINGRTAWILKEKPRTKNKIKENKTMKKILFAVALMSAICTSAHASGAYVQEVLQSSITVNVINVSTYLPTQVDNSGLLMSYRTLLAIQNLDLSYKIYCSQKSNVTKTTGFMLPEGGGLISLPLTAMGDTGRLTIYCVSSSTISATKAAIIQAY